MHIAVNLPRYFRNFFQLQTSGPIPPLIYSTRQYLYNIQFFHSILSEKNICELITQSVCLYVCMCVCPFTMKASPVWINQTTREQINDVVLETLFFYAKSLHLYFRMNNLTFLTSHFILFTHQKRVKPRFNQCASSFQSMGPSATIIRHCLRSALHRKSICLWRLHLQKGSQSNQKRLR